jgi:serine O-acetyltransferase
MTAPVRPPPVRQLAASLRRLRVRLCLPLASLALSSPAAGLIRADVAKWVSYGDIPQPFREADDLQRTAACLAFFREFRTLLFYRLSHCDSQAYSAIVPVLRMLWRPHPTLRFFPESLGPGCFILHGYATGIAARSIGANFTVGQHVVVGYRAPGEYPTIGDDVSIYAGAIVVGEITVGDGVTIGAGAVVVDDVPPGTTVVSGKALLMEGHAGAGA